MSLATKPREIYCGAVARPCRRSLTRILSRIKPGDYFAVTQYIEELNNYEGLLQQIRIAVRDEKKVATTSGYGPRFLHSTGQLHKGGPDTGVFLQITSEDINDIEIPGEKFTFGVLKQAQALGDFESLVARGRRAIRVDLGRDVEKGLRRLLVLIKEAVSQAAAAGRRSSEVRLLITRNKPQTAAVAASSKPWPIPKQTYPGEIRFSRIPILRAPNAYRALIQGHGSEIIMSTLVQPKPLKLAQPSLPQGDSCLLVIFGATGDLTHRKLIPALYDLACVGCTSRNFDVLGIGRTKLTDEEFRERLRDGAANSKDARNFTDEGWNDFAKRLHYLVGDANQPEFYPRLKAKMEEMQKNGASKNVLFYISTSASLAPPIVEGLGAAGLARNSEGWTRIILEKPFGRDLQSAHELNEIVSRVFDEPSVYRIDHYLGKETVQNIMMFRFGNSMFEPVWNRNYIDYIEITAAETLGVESRAAFYEETGASARHGREPSAPVADADRDGASRCLRRRRRARAQSGSAARHRSDVEGRGGSPDRFADSMGRAQIDGKPVPGYRQEKGVESEFAHRDLRRGRISRRQLALGRSSLLCARRQAAGQSVDRDCRSLQAHAASAVLPQSRGRAPQRHYHAHSAERRYLAELRCQAARVADARHPRGHGLLVSRCFRRRNPRGLRNAAARRDAR